MKILYFVAPLWILVASPSFVQNSKPQASNQFDLREQLQQPKSSRGRKNHRGSGRRHNSFTSNS
ncbi:MAG: hypothetical protein WBA07_25440 [Rivularia sp. (in: cyanobacteria)]